MSLSQERLWVLHERYQTSSAYHVPLLFDITGPLTAEAIRDALAEIVHRHECLRTSFVVLKGEPIQLVNRRKRVDVPVIDVRGVDADAQERLIERDVHALIRLPFDLSRRPLRAVLFRIGERRSRLLLVIHHLVFDGWSADVLLRELTTICEAKLMRRPWSLPDLPIQYADYAIQQRAWMATDRYARQLRYWEAQLCSPTYLVLPFERESLWDGDNRADREHIDCGRELSASLKALSSRERVSIFTTLLAGLLALLRRYSGQDDLVVGTVVANRELPDAAGLIGLFVNTLALRVNAARNPRWVEFLHRTADVSLAAYAHQGVPFDAVLDTIEPSDRQRQPPLFSIVVTMKNFHSRQHPRPSPRLWDITPVGAAAESNPFPMSVIFEERDLSLGCTLKYDTSRYTADAIRRMLGHYRALLASIVTDPQQHLSELQFVDDEERRRLLAGGSSRSV